MRSLPKNLKSPGLYEVDRQPQTCRQGITVENCRVNRLLFAGDLVLHAWIFATGSSVRIDRFSAACDQEGTKISSKEIEVLCLLRRPRKCLLQVSRNTLQQVETFKYLGMAFRSDESRNKGIDTRIGKVNAVLRELYCSVAMKRELSKNPKLSVFKSVFVPILICGHESSVTTESIVSNEQTAEMGYLRRVLGVTLRDNEHRSEICKPGMSTKRFQLCYFGHVSRLAQERRAMYPDCPSKERMASPSGYSLRQLCPAQTAYRAKNHVTVLTRAAH